MRFLAVCLIGCMLFLSVGGMIEPVSAQTNKKDCCQRMAKLVDKSSCKHQQSADQKNGCGKQGCSMMLTCSICSFIGVEPMKLQPVIAHKILKPVSLYKIGDLSAYHESNWKPPKAC